VAEPFGIFQNCCQIITRLRQGLIADELVLQLTTFLRSLDLFLDRLGTDYLDLYLLHWPVSNAHFPEAVAGFERLRAASGDQRCYG